MNKLSIFLLLFLSVFNTHSIIINETFSPEKSEKFGAKNFTQTVEIVSEFKNQAGGHMGTGVLVSPNAVLTAKHNLGASQDLQRVLINGNSKTMQGDQDQNLIRWGVHIIRHPDFDLALVKFVDPIRDVQPVKLYNHCLKTNQQAYMVGYGLTGNNRNGALPDTNHIRRAATTRISKITSAAYSYNFNPLETIQPGVIPSTFNNTGADSMQAIMASHDSGGPLLIGQTNKQLFLAGIASEIVADPITGLCSQTWVNIHPHLDWLNTNINKDLPSGISK